MDETPNQELLLNPRAPTSEMRRAPADSTEPPDWDDSAWACHECKDGNHAACVGVPCRCECPDPQEYLDIDVVDPRLIVRLEELAQTPHTCRDCLACGADRALKAIQELDRTHEKLSKAPHVTEAEAPHEKAGGDVKQIPLAGISEQLDRTAG